MWTIEERKAIQEFEDAAERAGGYLAIPRRPLIVDADYHAMSKYCTEKGINPTDLDEQEYTMFLYDTPLVYQ